MQIGLYAKSVKAGAKGVCGVLAGILRNDNAANEKPHCGKGVHKAHYLKVIGNAKVAAHLVFLNISGIYGNYYFRAVLHALKKPHLGVRRKAGQHPGGMEIVKKLSAEFKIELSAEMAYALLNFFGLHFKIFSAVKTDFLHILPPPQN